MQRGLLAILLLAGCQTTAPPPAGYQAPPPPADVIPASSPLDAAAPDAAAEERAVVCHRDHRSAPAPRSPAPPRPPQKTQKTPPVEGHLDVNVVQRPIRARFRCLRRCYQEGLARNPSLAGKVLVRFIIEGGTGNVLEAEGTGYDLKDPAVVACVADEIRDIHFPAPNGDVTVNYPISFAPDP
jgi:hypothetical protein